LRIIWTLEEVGAPYELVVMTREEGGADEHRRRHPLGRVPVLEDEDGFVFESAALCLHLGDLHPEAGLLPPLGTHDRALVYQWACFAPGELEPPLFEAWTQAEQDPERSSVGRERFFSAAGAVEAALDGSEYLVGDHFTVADIMVGSALMFTTRAGFADQLSPSLTEYMGRLAQRPAFQRAFQRTFD
jgi:glutathione S-transferase